MIPLRPFLLLAAGSLLAQDADDAPTLNLDAPAAVATRPDSDDIDDINADDAIPRAFPASRYESAWAKNPFLLKTAAVAQTTVSFAQDWALAGMYRSPSGKITVTLQNKQTNEFQRISSEGGDGEFQLVEAKFNRNRNEASVVISKGTQTAELKYDDALVSKPVTINNTLLQNDAAKSGAQPGQPGQPAAAAKGAPVSVTGGRPGAPAATPGAPGVTPPSISRRRQLIPPPTVSPQPAP